MHGLYQVRLAVSAVRKIRMEERCTLLGDDESYIYAYSKNIGGQGEMAKVSAPNGKLSVSGNALKALFDSLQEVELLRMVQMEIYVPTLRLSKTDNFRTDQNRRLQMSVRHIIDPQCGEFRWTS